jgi:hypothetical protein
MSSPSIDGYHRHRALMVTQSHTALSCSHSAFIRATLLL